MVLQRLLMLTVTIATLAIGIRALAWATVEPLRAVQSGTATVDEAVGAGAGIGAWLLAGWIVLTLALTALAALPGAIGRQASRMTHRFGPASVHRCARLALGLAVATGPVALASPALANSSAECVTSTATESDLPFIERPTRPDQQTKPVDHASAAPSERRHDREPDDTVTVQSGDSLWSIAADHLPPGSTRREVAVEWPRWFEANREVIGDDPDVIHPGITLQVPTS